MEADNWEAETYARLLMLIGGQNDADEMARAKALFKEFNHFFPAAKPAWDAVLVANNLEPVPAPTSA